jgi:surface antigen
MRVRALVSIGALFAGCATTGGVYGDGVNYASASALGAGLPPGEARALAPAFIQAVEKGAIGERFDWRGAAASGWVKAREFRVGNLKADPNDAPPVAGGVDLSETYETEQGLYALTRNANVRLGPSTDFPTSEQLLSGTGVVVVGKVVGKPWMLSEVDGEVVGYIHESLMIKAPGTELDLAGGPRREAAPCRAYEQQLSFGGQSDLWSGVACREDGRWVVKGRPADEPVKLF